MAVLTLTNNHVQKIEAELIRNGIRVSSVKGRQLLSTEEGVAVMLFLTVVLSREGRGSFAAAAAASLLWKKRFGNAWEIRDEFAAAFPRPFGLAAVSLAIERLRGKVPAVILDIWQDETLAFFGEGGADVDEFLARMFRVRWSVRVPEGENRDSIKVDTIHGTKGLQFTHVFVFWNEDEKSTAFYLPSQKCHVRFSSGETKCLQAGGSKWAREIIEQQSLHLSQLRRERANVFYVAATRAVRTLAVFLPVIKSGEYKAVHQAVLDTFAQFAPEGTKMEKSRFSCLPEDGERTAVWDAPCRRGGEPDPYGEIDPALISESIKAGIARGDRLHRWLARVLDPDRLPPPGELSKEEYDTAVRFVRRKEVFELMFGPGRLYVEQPISDKNDFGIVDRMIVSDRAVTIMDYKSGSLRGLRRKYDEQRERYTRIMKSLYPSRTVDYHILSIDP
jgi:ATP-dependent exoDNAse (exonuclease V) beta subunit